MSRVSLGNGAAVLVAVALSVGASSLSTATEMLGSPGFGSEGVLVDATGAAVALRNYRRIASGSTVADQLLLELCDPQRVVAYTEASAQGADASRYRSQARIGSIDEIEDILALRPDLLLVHNVGDVRRVERLRDAGLTVFDLGSTSGLGSLREDVRQLATLCGAADHGRRYVERFERRMREIAADLPLSRRRTAIYLSIYSDRLFGGTVGTSFHDVLVAAGLRDVATERHRGWPQYSVEDVLELDPEVIVTHDAMARTICDHEVLAGLRACAGGMVEVDPWLLSDPGPRMLVAAERIHRAVYPDGS